jgi:hypothetical protein
MARKQKGGLDAYIEIIYGRYCSGVQINVMDICKVFNEGRRLFQEGHKEAADLGPRLRAFVDGIARP